MMSCIGDAKETRALEATKEWSELERWDQRLENLMQELQQDLEKENADQAVLDDEYVEKWTETSRRLAVKLSRKPPAALAPEAVAKLRGIVVDAMSGQEASRDAPPLDRLDALLVSAESLRHVIRDAMDVDLGVDEADTGAVLEQLIRWLPGVSLSEIAALLGRSDRQLQRWRKDGPPSEGEAAERLVLVARLVVVLKRSWTPQGIIAWFDRSRSELDGQTPRSRIDDPLSRQLLLDLARRGRSQYGG
jgi:hypothetical protein